MGYWIKTVKKIYKKYTQGMEIFNILGASSPAGWTVLSGVPLRSIPFGNAGTLRVPAPLLSLARRLAENFFSYGGMLLPRREETTKAEQPAHQGTRRKENKEGQRKTTGYAGSGKPAEPAFLAKTPWLNSLFTGSAPYSARPAPDRRSGVTLVINQKQ
jgi:hypothetical protein